MGARFNSTDREYRVDLASGCGLPGAWRCGVGFVFLVLFFSALKGVYTAVLYRYAVTGEDSLFDPEIVGSAFRSKR